MSEKKTIKDYISGGIAIVLFLVPEVVKITVSAMYLGGLYMLSQVDTSNINEPTASILLISLMICPIGAYYFYSKSIVREVYEDGMKYLAKRSSVFNPEKRLEGE